MRVIEFLEQAQYSRLTVGNRWMTACAGGFKVLEKPRRGLRVEPMRRLWVWKQPKSSKIDKVKPVRVEY